MINFSLNPNSSLWTSNELPENSGNVPVCLADNRIQSRITTGLLFLFFIVAGMTSVAIADDLKLLDLVKSDVGICAEVKGLEAKIDSLKSSPIVNRFCQSLIYKEWRSSKDFRKVSKGRKNIESVTNRPIEEVISTLFGKTTIIAFFPEEKKWSALLLAEARDEESLKELLQIWIKSGSHQTEDLDFEGNAYHRRYRKNEDGSENDVVYYIQHKKYFALSGNESRIQDVIKIYTLAEEEGLDSEEFQNISLGYSEEYLAARNSLPADYFSTIYLNPERIGHLIGRHLKKAKDLTALYHAWNKLKSGIIGIQLDETSFAVNLSFIKKETASPFINSEFAERMQGASEFLSHVPGNAILSLTGKIHLKNVEKLITKLAENTKNDDLENIRQVSRGLLLGLDLFDDVLPSLKANWGAYLVPKEHPDLKTFPLDALVAFGLPENDVIIKNGGRVSLKGALDNGLNTGLNLLAAFYNSEKLGKPAIVRTEKSNGFTLRWIDSLWSYLPSYGLNQQDFVLATDPDLIRNYVTKQPENGLAKDSALQNWMDKYTRKENQWLVLNFREAHSYISKQRDFFIQHIMQEKDISQEEAIREIDEMTSISKTFDFCLAGLYLGSDELQILIGVTCNEAP